MAVTPEQAKALALAAARKRQAEAQGSPRQFVGPPAPSRLDRARSSLRRVGAAPDVDPGVAHGLGRTARMAAEAVGALPLMAADAGVAARNLMTGSRYEFPSSMYQKGLDSLGLPRPQGTAEKVVDVLGQMAIGSRLPVPQVKNPAPVAYPIRPPSTAPGAATLEDAGVRLDRAQATGDKAWNAVRAASQDHPATAGRQQEFTVNQLKDFTRAVLRRIGIDSDQASQPAMIAAKNRIGSVFNSIGSKGAQFDDVLQTEVSAIMDDALRTVPDSSTGVIQRNVDDILKAVDQNGVINGQQFIRIRSHLSQLSGNADVAHVASDLEDALLGALQRSHPEERAALSGAIEQWRSMRIIESAVGKGVDRYVMPMQLSNAIGNKANRAMRVYGQGGDQYLVQLAEAGRTVLPQSLPNSGTAPRLGLQSFFRTAATAIPYRMAQTKLLSRPPLALPPGGGVRNALAGATAPVINSLRNNQ